MCVCVCTYSKASLSHSTLRALRSRSSSRSNETRSSRNTRSTLERSNDRIVIFDVSVLFMQTMI